MPQVHRLLQSEFSKMWSSASSFNFCLLFSLQSPSRCSCLFPLPLIVRIFPAITCFRRQFLRKMCPIQMLSLRFILCWMFPPILSLSNTSSFHRIGPNFLLFSHYQISPEPPFKIEGRTDQRNAQINFSLINLLLFKLLRHVSATQLEPSSGSLKSLQVTSHCNLLGY